MKGVVLAILLVQCFVVFGKPGSHRYVLKVMIVKYTNQHQDTQPNTVCFVLLKHFKAACAAGISKGNVKKLPSTEERQVDKEKFFLSFQACEKTSNFWFQCSRISPRTTPSPQSLQNATWCSSFTSECNVSLTILLQYETTIQPFSK